MERPLSFVIEKNNELELNEEILKVIQKSNNPRLLLFYGSTRQGKSTTLNQIIRGNIETWKYINKSPFPAQTSQKSLTVGCDIYGPIKCSEIIRRHKLDKNIKEDFDIFFCDTEGLFSLNGQSRTLIPGILTLLQICTFSVIMINTVPDTNTIDQLLSEIQFSKILQQINKEIESPLVSIYISGYQIDIAGKDDFDECINEYQDEREETADLILKKMNEKYPHLNITKKDYKVIPGGPYEHNYLEEPDHNNIKAKLYWYFINDIVKEFVRYSKKTKNKSGNKLIFLMKVVFDIFKDFKELPKDANLSNVLMKYIVDNFNKYSIKQFEKISEEVKKDLKYHYDEYYKMLNDDIAAKSKLDTCIEENMIEIYKSLIPDKMKNFYENATLKLRNAIETQFEKEFEIKCKELLSYETINTNIANIKNEIDRANFKEDINKDIIQQYKEIWKSVEKENEKLFIYFLEKKPENIEILKTNFNNSIEKVINNLISKKKEWKVFFEEIKGQINKEINEHYLEIFRTIQYQEDFEKKIKSNDLLFNELIEKYNKKYFEKLQYEKKNAAMNWIKKVCEKEYNKLKEDNKLKPKWENIYKNVQTRITDILNNYLNSIFQGKKFKNEIDPNLGRNEKILSKIPNDLINNPEISHEKRQFLQNYLNNAIYNAVILFNKKREELPYIEKALSDTEALCKKIADEKIKELMSKFHYAEDKIPFNSDNFYSLFKKNEKLISIAPQNKKEFNDIINDVSQKKDNEYNNILVPQLPSWNKKKEKIKLKIEKECDEYYKNIMHNKYYKEEIIYDIKDLGNLIKSLNLFKGILNNNKQNEIKELINNMIKKTQNKIINESNKLSNWSEKKELLIQKGISIMTNKCNTDLGTDDINKIINDLIYEIIIYPNFLDSCKNESQSAEILEELNIQAKQLGKSYLSKKKEIRDQIEKLKQHYNKLLDEQKNNFDKNNKANNDIINQLRNQINELNNRLNPPHPPPPPPPPQVRYFPATPYTGYSIVDGLAAIGAIRTYEYRAQIAAKNGISGYAGTPQQNLHMLGLLKQGRLIMP